MGKEINFVEDACCSYPKRFQQCMTFHFNEQQTDVAAAAAESDHNTATVLALLFFTA